MLLVEKLFSKKKFALDNEFSKVSRQLCLVLGFNDDVVLAQVYGLLSLCSSAVLIHFEKSNFNKRHAIQNLLNAALETTWCGCHDKNITRPTFNALIQSVNMRSFVNMRSSFYLLFGKPKTKTSLMETGTDEMLLEAVQCWITLVHLI